MNWWTSIRLKIGDYLLRKNRYRNKSKPHSLQFEQVLSVGLLCTIKEEKDLKIVMRYVKNLKERGIRSVEVLAYAPQKEVPEFLVKQQQLHYFGRKQRNWLFQPKGDAASTFLGNQFEVLIDLSEDNDFALRYVLAVTQARIKVGRDSAKRSEFYDLMIQVQPGKDLNYFIEQADHYLNLINKTPSHVE